MLYSFVFHCDFSNPNRITNRVGGKQRILGVFLLLPLFPDLSHHRTCRSAYGGSLHSVQLNVVAH